MRASDIERRSRIHEAAYTVLAERGYRGSSFLTIATAAGVSNQTMYRWYGTKAGLFRAMIEENASAARVALEAALNSASGSVDALAEVAYLVLQTVTSTRAIDLNRAAASDASETGELGEALAASGRGLLLPLVASLLTRAHERSEIRAPDVQEAAEVWVSLVVGDLQVRLVTGAISRPSDLDLQARATAASARFLSLCQPGSTPEDVAR